MMKCNHMLCLHFPAFEIFALEHLSLIKKLVYQQLEFGRINYGMIEISIALLKWFYDALWRKTEAHPYVTTLAPPVDKKPKLIA